MTKLLRLAAFIILCATPLCAQDIAGDWQGTLNKGATPTRLVLQITREDNGNWKPQGFYVDQQAQFDGVVTFDGANLKASFVRIQATYEGKLSADGTSFNGTWTQGAPIPLELKRANKETAWPKDTTPHSAQFVTVEKGVKLEVLDWGGTGPPLIFLTGLGDNVHIYDKFAPKFIGAYHVYGITRRGFGASSMPPSGYSADRLGDDVLAVIDALKINKPVLVGHSIGGEELSSVGSRYPEKVAGLIYLDAAYSYAFYDRARGESADSNHFNVDLMDLQKKLEQLLPGNRPQDPRALVRELLETNLPDIEKDLKDLQKNLPANPPAAPPGPPPVIPVSAVGIMRGMQKYTEIKVPVLAIYALPHDFGPRSSGDARAASDAKDLAETGAQAKAFETGVPSARVVRLAHAQHYVFQSNEADVLREMNAFLSSLP